MGVRNANTLSKTGCSGRIRRKRNALRVQSGADTTYRSMDGWMDGWIDGTMLINKFGTRERERVRARERVGGRERERERNGEKRGFSHHAGSTLWTGMMLKAGVPSLVCPFVGEQARYPHFLFDISFLRAFCNP